MAAEKASIAYAEGDGIGPEIMAATLHVLNKSDAQLEYQKVEIGEKVYLSGQSAGIAPEAWDIIRGTKAFLKAPITTPQGGGYKSLNVTVRTTLGLYANVRPCVTYHPFVATKHPGMNVVIIRENEEDLYTGIEYRQTNDTFQALKIMTRPGCERIVRYAFEYARSNNRKKVTCFTKDNILKMSDGLFHKVFEEIAVEYPDIENEHWIIDIGAAKLAHEPERFDVVVLPNLYGDILSDVGAQIAGSVGMAGSANIGISHAMFEGIHGSAPRHAGENSANPSALMLSSVMMLVHLGQPEAAAQIHNAWLRTIEDGLHTYDIFNKGGSKEKMGTQEFAQAVAKRIGQKPQTLEPVEYSTPKPMRLDEKESKTSNKQLFGVDVFVDFTGGVDSLVSKLQAVKSHQLELKMIGNRGVKVWPDGYPETLCVDSWRCRFANKEDGAEVTHEQIAKLLTAFANEKIDFTQTEQLYNFDGEPGYNVMPK